MMNSILEGLTENQKIDIVVSSDVESELEDLCLNDLSHGGRGIRNMIEAYFVNPLSRALFDRESSPGDSFVVSQLVVDEFGPKVNLT